MAARNELKAEGDAASRSIVTTRIIAAPRDLVFEAWTSPMHLAKWWGPDGFTTTTAFEMREGGVWRFVMHGPDGRDYENHITFDEIARPERIAYRHGGGGDTAHIRFSTTVTFEDMGGKTRITMSALFPTAAERDRVVKEHGAIEGAAQCVARLADYAGALAALRANPASRTVELVRVLDAPRELVFKCWTEPKHFAAWWGPHGFTAPKVELDVRPGGGIFVLMSGPPPWQHHPMGGEFREIVPPERIVFTSKLETDGKLLLENLNTVTLEDLGGGRTKMTVRAQVLFAVPEMTGALAGMEMGWSQSLEKLAAHIAKL